MKKKLLTIILLALLVCVVTGIIAGQRGVKSADRETTGTSVIQATLPKSLARLEGLDRLYFQHVGRAGSTLDAPPVIASVLPDVLRLADREAINAASLPEGINVRDFHVPLNSQERDLWIRQIVYDRGLRIAKLWWALYDRGQRSDVWYFIPNPSKNENKILLNYEIMDASTAGNGTVALRIKGSMFRPQGAWSIVGKVITFSTSDAGLVFSHVCNAFGFFQGYDIGDGIPPIDISTERELKGRFEDRTYVSVPKEVLRECKFRDPLENESWEFSWDELERVALCVTKEPGVKTTFRSFNEPSFIERGGRSSE
jgi:hypothetical protein